jgi:Ca2+-binding RTX toxin-like protein
LPSATVAVNNGVLTIDGTDTAETIEIRLEDPNDPSSDVIVNITDSAARWSVVSRQDRDSIHSLVVRALDGNDLVRNATNISGIIRGGEGRDTLLGGTGANWLYGDADNDDLYGNSANDWLYGGTGNDDLYGGGSADRLYGGDDSDTLLGGNGADFLWGGAGADFLYGQVGNDVLRGGAGNDWLEGGIDNDFLYGEGGLDTLFGQAGSDWLEGGYDGQQDVLWGGTEADTFVEYWQQFVNLRALAETDRVMDQGVFGHWERGLFVIDGWDVVFQKSVTIDDWLG